MTIPLLIAILGIWLIAKIIEENNQ